MTRRTRLLVTRAFLVGVAIAALSGCEGQNLNQGPVALAFHDGGVDVAFCQESNATRLLVNEKKGSWRAIWIADGSTHVGVGEIVSADSLAERFDSVTMNADPDESADGLEVTLLAENADSNISASFSLPSELPGTGKWLKPNGSISDTPCG